MALNTLKCNRLTPLHFKGLTVLVFPLFVTGVMNGMNAVYQIILLGERQSARMSEIKNSRSDLYGKV